MSPGGGGGREGLLPLRKIGPSVAAILIVEGDDTGDLALSKLSLLLGSPRVKVQKK